MRYPAMAIAVIIALTAACGGSDGGSDDNKGPQQDKQAVQEVQAAFLNLAKVSAVTADIQSQVRQPNGAITQSVFKYDFVPPDRYQLTSASGGISRVVNDELFSYANNTWTRLDDYSGRDYAGFDHFFNPKFMSDLAREVGVSATVDKGGTENVNGKSCQAYVLTVVATGNTTDVCIADNYPLKVVYHTNGLDTTAIFSNFNAKIELPRPIP